MNKNTPIATRLFHRFHQQHCLYLMYSYSSSDPNCLQGFFTLQRNLSVAAILKYLTADEHPIKKKHVIEELHLEPAKQTSKELFERYSGGNYMEFGELPYPGKRGGVRTKCRRHQHVAKPPESLNKDKKKSVRHKNPWKDPWMHL